VRSLENFIATLHPDDRAGVIERCERCAREGADVAMEFRVIWPDRSQHWLDDQGRTFFDDAGKPLYMTGACVDSTERKRTEEEIRRLNASLEQRVRERTAELETAVLLRHGQRRGLRHAPRDPSFSASSSACTAGRTSREPASALFSRSEQLHREAGRF